jgi:hypothetical protein
MPEYFEGKCTIHICKIYPVVFFAVAKELTQGLA